MKRANSMIKRSSPFFRVKQRNVVRLLKPLNKQEHLTALQKFLLDLDGLCGEHVPANLCRAV